MNSFNNNSEQLTQEIKQAIDVIAKANECGVLMTLLCEKMGLVAHETTQGQFTQAFTELQKARLKAEELMQSQFVMARPEKTRKTRESKKAFNVFKKETGQVNEFEDDIG